MSNTLKAIGGAAVFCAAATLGASLAACYFLAAESNAKWRSLAAGRINTHRKRLADGNTVLLVAYSVGRFLYKSKTRLVDGLIYG